MVVIQRISMYFKVFRLYFQVFLNGVKEARYV